MRRIAYHASSTRMAITHSSRATPLAHRDSNLPVRIIPTSYSFTLRRRLIYEGAFLLDALAAAPRRIRCAALIPVRMMALAFINRHCRCGFPCYHRRLGIFPISMTVPPFSRCFRCSPHAAVDYVNYTHAYGVWPIAGRRMAVKMARKFASQSLPIIILILMITEEDNFTAK